MACRCSDLDLRGRVCVVVWTVYPCLGESSVRWSEPGVRPIILKTLSGPQKALQRVACHPKNSSLQAVSRGFATLALEPFQRCVSLRKQRSTLRRRRALERPAGAGRGTLDRMAQHYLSVEMGVMGAIPGSWGQSFSCGGALDAAP